MKLNKQDTYMHFKEHLPSAHCMATMIQNISIISSQDQAARTINLTVNNAFTHCLHVYSNRKTGDGKTTLVFPKN